MQMKTIFFTIQSYACPLTSEKSFINIEAEADHFDLFDIKTFLEVSEDFEFIPNFIIWICTFN